MPCSITIQSLGMIKAGNDDFLRSKLRHSVVEYGSRIFHRRTFRRRTVRRKKKKILTEPNLT